ncbi:hypothetical protein [Methyloglobulus sp.]|uniref:hypothetical protein n=1 Tax=Methyloglobulus sp. TaxID=2518622 RepID=UPI003989CEB4
MSIVGAGFVPAQATPWLSGQPHSAGSIPAAALPPSLAVEGIAPTVARRHQI